MNIDDKKYSRLRAIYSDQQLESLFNSKVLIAGLGGVGSYCATALARAGLGSLFLIDFDTIEKSNINRQEFANENTLGKKKVDLASQFIKDINADIFLKTYDYKIDENTIKDIDMNVDYVVDAIDDIPAKINLAKYAQENSIPIVSCMGTALRKDPSLLKFDDIYNTSVCPLCKEFRKQARVADIENLEVLYSTEPALKSQNNKLGSTSYLPPIAGFLLAYKVIEKLTI